MKLISQVLLISAIANLLVVEGGKKSAKRSTTLWWVLFNKPSACEHGMGDGISCGMGDVMGVGDNGGANPAQIAIIYAGGGLPNKWGKLSLSSVLYKSSGSLNLGSSDGQYLYGGPSVLYNSTVGSIGYCPSDGEETEVHLVLRDHGPPTKPDKRDQITMFTDPSCSGRGGSNLCADSGVVAFPPMTSDGVMTKDVGHFAMFPPGCADAGECTMAQECVQLSAGMDNKATLIKTGDAFQALVKVKLPALPSDYYVPEEE